MSTQIDQSMRRADDGDVRPLGDDLPGMEPWLAVALLCFVPIIGAAFVPPAYARVFLGAGVITLMAGVLMFLVRNNARARRRNDRP